MNNKRGSILAIVIIFIFIFTLLGMFAMRLVILQNETSDSELYYTRAHFAALYGSELALHRIMQWESIATGTTAVNPDGRKFLAEDSSCFNYKNGKWYPLEGLAAFEENFTDEVTGGVGSGIHITCSVEEDTDLNVNDGFLPDQSPTSLDQRYGTYKYYIIKTTATIYKNLAAKTNDISEAKDYMYFFIAYSSGSAGAKYIDDIEEDGGNNVIGFINDPDMVLEFPLSDPDRRDNIIDAARHYTSAEKRSIVTGKVLPIFRYFIRGRR